MKFNQEGHWDDVWFVILLLLPTVFVGARYLESGREMDRIAQARPQAMVAVGANYKPENLHLALAQSHGR